jgi:ABC-2 type transport system permease protein
MCAAPAARRPVSAEAEPEPVSDISTAAGGTPVASLDLLLSAPRARTGWRVMPARVVAMCVVELQKLSHDRTELYTRAVQPALWLLIFGETFTRIRAIPTGGIPYLDFLAPGIIAQSAMFIAIFYGIMIIWERDSGVLTKLLVTPTPRAALVTGKAFAAGVKALIQAVVVIVIAAVLGVAMTWNPLRLLGMAVCVILGAAFFSCLSMSIAGIVLTRDRLMGIGQAITMPLFFGSNALYPLSVMPGWLQTISKINPLSYQVDALRGLLLGTPSHLPADFGVLALAAALGITAASALLGRLAR